MASALFRQAIKERNLSSKIRCDSAGIKAVDGENITDNAKLALKELGTECRPHKAKLFSLQQLKKNKFVFTMTNDIKMKIRSNCMGALNVYTLAEYTSGEDIPDPYGKAFSDYLEVARYLKYLINRLLDRLVKELCL